MSDDSAKKKPRKTAQDGVLGTLPSTRPARVGRARTGSSRASAATADGKPPRTAPDKPRAESRPRPRTPKPPPEPPPRRREDPPTGADLAVTAARAAGELAQIGASFGVRVLKRAAGRIPRP
jgi:hypothetical protein